VTERVFRASRAYELVPFDRLSVREQANIGELARDPEFFGVLRPRAPGDGTVKAVSRNVALLVYALQTAGPIPRVAVAGGDDSIVDAVRRLTLDGVLELERDGTFVSGPGVFDVSHERNAETAVARISRDALRLVATIANEDSMSLGDRLYRFNRRPLTPRWSANVRTPGDVLRFAGAGASTKTALTLERQWKRRTADLDGAWISWWPRDASRNRRRIADTDVTHKLYVSPRTEALPEVFPAVVDALADAGAPPFKIGASAAGILRPDKLVIYLERRDAAQDVAFEISKRLGDTPAHPVPFTREVAGDGLVSAGMDPPSARALINHVGASWRLWICRRLGSYVASAQRSGAAEGAARFALERIALDGIDPSTWEPSETAVRGFASEARE
jgi:hypothetical protein